MASRQTSVPSTAACSAAGFSSIVEQKFGSCTVHAPLSGYIFDNVENDSSPVREHLMEKLDSCVTWDALCDTLIDSKLFKFTSILDIICYIAVIQSGIEFSPKPLDTDLAFDKLLNAYDVVVDSWKEFVKDDLKSSVENFVDDFKFFEGRIDLVFGKKPKPADALLTVIKSNALDSSAQLHFIAFLRMMYPQFKTGDALEEFIRHNDIYTNDLVTCMEESEYGSSSSEQSESSRSDD
jgi:hypothetical protein